MEDQVKDLFFNQIRSLELSSDAYENIWNQFYAVFLMPLISNTFEAIQQKNTELFESDFDEGKRDE